MKRFALILLLSIPAVAACPSSVTCPEDGEAMYNNGGCKPTMNGSACLFTHKKWVNGPNGTGHSVTHSQWVDCGPN